MSNKIAQVIEDSICNGIRIISFQVQAPKFLDAEISKHRMLSTNSSSDRAIPVSKMVEQEPYIPDTVFLNKAGMRGSELMGIDEHEEYKDDMLMHHDDVINLMLKWKHVHKQHINRLLLPFSYQSKIITATEWDNFFRLRISEAAQPEIMELAVNMRVAMTFSEPVEREWHLPYVTVEERSSNDFEYLAKLSSARCARVSYNNHDGSKPDAEKDLELFNQLATRPYTDKRGYVHDEDDPIHGSALEHAAKAMTHIKDVWSDVGQTHMKKDGSLWSANFRGWNQFRQMLGA